MLLSAGIARADAIAFGFTDHAGKKLIVLTKDAPRFAHAICKAGLATQVEWLNQQPSHDPPSRQTALEFDRLAGDVYVLAQATEPNQTCVLYSDREPIATTTVGGKCDAATKGRLGKARSRGVKSCTRLATVAGEGDVVTAEYRKVGKRALGVVAWLRKRELTLRDQAALCDGKEPSCWRVDDGNQWDPEGFTVLTAFRSPHGLELAITWGGAEGENATLYRAIGPKLEEVVTTYRYWNPE